MRRTVVMGTRAGAGAVALAMTFLLAVPGPAHAAEPAGPVLIAQAADLNTPSARVGGGDRRPIRASVHNAGDAPATGVTFTVGVGEGAAIVERYAECTYTDYWPSDDGGPWAYGPGEATCTVPVTLAPGQTLALATASGRSLFTARFGRNLWGPDEHFGSFAVAPAAETPPAGPGPSLTALLGAPRSGPTLGEGDYASFSYHSRRNAIDIAVQAPPISGAVGDTVDLTYQVVNNGPSDGSGPGVVITAPSGTVLLPAEWCWTAGTPHDQLPESAALECNFESYFPTVHSGYGRVGATVQLKINSKPGRDGSIRVRGEIVAGTEWRPINNTVPIIVRAR